MNIQKSIAAKMFSVLQSRLGVGSAHEHRFVAHATNIDTWIEPIILKSQVIGNFSVDFALGTPASVSCSDRTRTQQQEKIVKEVNKALRLLLARNHKLSKTIYHETRV